LIVGPDLNLAVLAGDGLQLSQGRVNVVGRKIGHGLVAESINVQNANAI
jgi:hypothetical protein